VDPRAELGAHRPGGEAGHTAGTVEADRIAAPANEGGQVLENEGLREVNAERSALGSLADEPVDLASLRTHGTASLASRVLFIKAAVSAAEVGLLALSRGGARGATRLGTEVDPDRFILCRRAPEGGNSMPAAPGRWPLRSQCSSVLQSA
jgi:hypothetical protein